MIFNYALVTFALSAAVSAIPQAYPNKCGDQVCPADKPKCCAVNVNGVAEIGCFAECPPVQAALKPRQTYPNKCGDQVCPADKAKCCEVIVNGVAELGCFAECPPVQAVLTPRDYPNKCGDNVCTVDRPKCCAVLVNGVYELGCYAECPAPPPASAMLRRREQPTGVAAASPSTPTFGPKCGDSFFCPVGQVCCPNALYHCADPDKVNEQCPATPMVERREQPAAVSAASPATPTFGPKCGDSFFCPVGQVCCPNALYHCADPTKVSQQCPQ